MPEEEVIETNDLSKGTVCETLTWEATHNECLS